MENIKSPYEFLKENAREKDKTKEGHIKHFIHKQGVVYYIEKYLEYYKKIKEISSN